MSLFFILLAIAALALTAGNVMATSAQSSSSPSLPLSKVTTKVSTSSTCGYKSDSSITGSAITNDSSTWPGSDLVWNICAAIAIAEGYNQGGSVAPYCLNNPGDLSPGDESDQATAGPAQFHGGSNIIFFATAESGWTALYDKFNNIIQGQSSVYPQDADWQTVAETYAGNSAAWLNNVTSYLGVDPSSTPYDYVNGGSGNG